MIYLLDADVLINAERDYYPRERVPEFWNWLLHHAERGAIRTLRRITSRLKQQPTKDRPEDPLSEWIRAHEGSLLIEPPDRSAVLQVWTRGYQQGASALDLPNVDDDAFLVAAALTDPAERIVVTMEKRSTKKGLNRRIPQVCDAVGVRCIDTFQFIRALDFRTDWGGAP